MEQKEGIGEERDVLSGAMAWTIKKKVHGEKIESSSSPPPLTLHCRFEIPLFLFLEGCL